MSRGLERRVRQAGRRGNLLCLFFLSKKKKSFRAIYIYIIKENEKKKNQAWWTRSRALLSFRYRRLRFTIVLDPWPDLNYYTEANLETGSPVMKGLNQERSFLFFFFLSFLFVFRLRSEKKGKTKCPAF